MLMKAIYMSALLDKKECLRKMFWFAEPVLAKAFQD